MVEIFDTHKFLFTLNHEGQIKDLIVTFIDKTGNEKKIELKEIQIGTSPISCILIDKNNIKYRTPFVKIKTVHKKDELIWDNTKFDLSNSKTINGF